MPELNVLDPRDPTTQEQNDPILELESEEGTEIGPGGRAHLPILLDEEIPRSRPDPTRETRTVAAIQTGNVLLTQLARDETVPKFSGRSADFDEFQWQLERCFKNVAAYQGAQLGEQFKMIMLEKALP